MPSPFVSPAAAVPEYARIDRDVFVRHPANPVLTGRSFPTRMRAVYNSSAIKIGPGRYVMICRVNQLNHLTLIWPADSTDGIHFTPRPEPYALPTDPLWKSVARSVAYDPRITFLDGEYKVLIACEGDQGCRVALFRSPDLAAIEFVHFINVPSNRNMVLFPEKSADGRYLRLERPNNEAGKGNIWLSHSPDLIHWGDSHEVLKTTELWNYAYSGLGASTVPLRTPEGWLMLYHAVMNNCTTREYSVGAALLDLERPWIVRHVTRHPVLYPEAPYEMQGCVEHVCFPCAKILEDDGTLRLYYGGADTVQCVAEARLSDVIHACKHW